MNVFKEEVKKIFSYKVNQVSCIALLLWILLICVSAMLQESIIVDLNSPRLSGREAIKLEMSEFSKRKGLLTNEKVNEYITRIRNDTKDRDVNEEKAEQILDDKSLVSYQEIVCLLNSTLKSNLDTDESTPIFKVKTPINFYADWSKKSSFANGHDVNKTKISKPFYYDYARGWQTIINKFADLMLGLLIVISICLSNIFTEDGEQHMKAVLLTSKYGRKHYVSSKIRASLTTTTVLYLFSVFIFMVGIFLEYGINGGNVSVQIGSSMFYSGNMNNFEAVIRMVFLGYIATVFMSFIILFLSTLCKTSFKVAGTSILLCMIPFVFISFAKPNFLMSCIFPIVLIDHSNIFTSSYMNIGGGYISETSVSIATILLFVILMYVFIKIKMRRQSYVG